MKKRLLALALCLVMVSSLLPVTAYADGYTPSFVGLEDGKTYCGAVTFSVSVEPGGSLSVGYQTSPSEPSVPITPDGGGNYTLPAGIGSVTVIANYRVDIGGGIDLANGLRVTVNKGHTWGAWTSNGARTHTHTCSGCNASETKTCADTSPADCKCDVAGESLHDWQFTKTDSTLTGTCGKGDIDPLNLTLKADSVTLPTSPFNARLEGLEQFKAVIPNAVIGEFVYKYKGPGDSEYRIVEPTAANAKAGEYQVGVRIKNLPGPVESDGPVAMAFEENPDGIWYADLYVKYTAVDPAVTAQTGDNRPIELMMGSVVLFSALAAAAFILDHKRKYSR